MGRRYRMPSQAQGAVAGQDRLSAQDAGPGCESLPERSPGLASATMSRMPASFPRRVPLAELHCHLGGAVTPVHHVGDRPRPGDQLPTKDYWEFRDMITVSPRHGHSFDGYLQLFHWTELIQSSPLAIERSVYEVVGGAYRKNNVTTIELRFNPMKRNRGGEQDLDHIISAAIRGMDRAVLEYPVRPGPDPVPGPGVPVPAQRDHGREGDRLPRARGGGHRHRRPRDRRRSECTSIGGCSIAAAGQGLGITVHTGEAGPVEEIAEVIEQLEPARIGHGVKAAYDPRTMAMIRERGIVLEVCPTSNLNTRVVSGWDEFRWIFDTFRRNGVQATPSTPTAPRCSRPTSATSSRRSSRLGILSLEEQLQSAEWARQASFVEGVHDIAPPRLRPPTRRTVEREEA